MRGYFEITLENSRKLLHTLRVPNSIPAEAEEAYVKMIFQDDEGTIAGGANFYVGLTGPVTPTGTLTLADMVEPTVANGYSRQPLPRSVAGWPNVDLINGNWRAQSAPVAFTASGGAFDQDTSRLFLTNVSAGTAGKLLAISEAIVPALAFGDTDSRSLTYNMFIG